MFFVFEFDNPKLGEIKIFVIGHLRSWSFYRMIPRPLTRNSILSQCNGRFLSLNLAIIIIGKSNIYMVPEGWKNKGEIDRHV